MNRIINSIATITTAISLYAAVNWVIDYFLYALIIWRFGSIRGGLLLAVIMFIIDFLTVRFYDWAKTDWLAIEYAKEKLDSGYYGRYISSVKSEYRHLWMVLCVVILSLKFNPFITTVVMRDGTYTYNGLSRRDWAIFVSSHLIGQLYWISLISGGLAVLRQVFSRLL